MEVFGFDCGLFFGKKWGGFGKTFGWGGGQGSIEGLFGKKWGVFFVNFVVWCRDF